MKKSACIGLIWFLAIPWLFYKTAPAHAGCQNLRDVAVSIARQLSKNLQDRGYTPGQHRENPIVFISRNYLTDPHQQTIYPFSSYLSEELAIALAETRQFDVIDGTIFKPDLYLSCTYHQEHDQLIINCQLKGESALSHSQETVFITFAGARTELARQYWSSEWFIDDIRDRMFFLMQKIESKSFNKLVHLADQRHVMVNKLRFQNSDRFSPFSEYISQFALDYFTKSSFLIPVTPQMTEKRLANFRSTETRHVVPESTRSGSLAAMVQASHYIEGSYWRLSENEIKVRCLLANLAGETLASDSIRIDVRQINPEWLVIPQSENEDLMDRLKVPSADMNVELFTQKGRSSLYFRMGEEILFLIKSSAPAYIRLFVQGTDGNVYQMFPNVFDAGTQMVAANQVVSIPNDRYPPTFEFRIWPPPGNIIVLAVASDQALPELPGSDSYTGGKQMALSLPQIRAAYIEHARRHQIMLAGDVLPMVTGN